MPADVALGVRWSASDRVADALIRGTRLVGALGICAANTLSRSMDANSISWVARAASAADLGDTPSRSPIAIRYPG